jgi:cytochrome b involved in lipid metabolism
VPSVYLENIHKHLNKDKQHCIVLYGFVVDVTDYLEEHPGGSEILLDYCGVLSHEGATKAFVDIGHTNEATKLIGKYAIYKLAEKIEPYRRLNSIRVIRALADVEIVTL